MLFSLIFTSMFLSTLLMIVVLLALILASILLSTLLIIVVLLASILLSIVLLITVLFSLILLVIVFSIFVIWLPTWPFNSSIAFLLSPMNLRFSIAIVPATLMSCVFLLTWASRSFKLPLTPSIFWSILMLLELILTSILLFTLLRIVVLLASILVSIFLLITVLFALILLVIVFSIFVICVPTWPFNSSIAFLLSPMNLRFSIAIVPATLISFSALSTRLVRPSKSPLIPSTLTFTLLILLLITLLFSVIFASIFLSTLLMIVVLLASILLLIVVSTFVICVPTWPFNSSIAFWLAFTPSSTMEMRVELSARLSCKKSKRWSWRSTRSLRPFKSPLTPSTFTLTLLIAVAFASTLLLILVILFLISLISTWTLPMFWPTLPFKSAISLVLILTWFWVLATSVLIVLLSCSSCCIRPSWLLNASLW